MATGETGQSRRRPRERKREGQTAQSVEFVPSNDQFTAGSDMTSRTPGDSSESGGSRGAGRGLGEELRQLVRNRTYEQIDIQKERATSNLGTLAGAVGGMTQQLRDNGQPGLAGYVTPAGRPARDGEAAPGTTSQPRGFRAQRGHYAGS